jgi:glycosyltransferase involved in cell wall biosynthesis
VNRANPERALRIVRAMPFFEPARRFGGPVAQAEATTRELSRRGHSVEIVTSDLGVGLEVPMDAWCTRDGSRRFYARTGWRHRTVPYLPPRAARRALREACSRADVVLGNVGLTLWNRVAWHEATRRRLPFVYNAEGALCPVRLRAKRWRKAAFVRAVERPILRGADALIALTAKDTRDMTALGARAERIVEIPNGVELTEPLTAAERRAARTSFGFTEDDVVVLFLGRLDPLKGLDLLLAGLARASIDAGTKLLAVGPDDGAMAMLDAAARSGPLAGRIVRTGAVDEEGRRRALAAADLFALTSRSEGLPVALLEALAAGLPAIVTAACNVPEVGTAGAGEVVAADPDAVAAALTRLAGSESERARQAAAARRLAGERFAIARTVDRLEALLLDLTRR